MGFYVLKIAITTVLIVLISEISKRSSFAGAILASVPIVSLLAMIWLYVGTKDVAKVADLSATVFWLVLPSLVFFVLLPVLLKNGVDFYLSMLVSTTITVGCYFLLISIIKKLGVQL